MSKVRPVSSSSKSKEDKCSDCGKAVMEREKGLECEVCEGWFHSKCQQVSDDTYKTLGQDTSLHWFCSGCNKGSAKLLRMMKELQDMHHNLDLEVKKVTNDVSEIKGNMKVLDDHAKNVKVLEEQVKVVDTKMDKDVKKVAKDVKEIKEEVKALDIQVKTVDTKIETLIETKLVENYEKIEIKMVENYEKTEVKLDAKVKDMKEDVDEQMEIEKRKNNLVFHGMKEPGVISLDTTDLGSKHPDQELVEEVLKTGLRLDATRHIEEVQRIGKYVPGKCRPLRVKIKTYESKVEILKRAAELKSVDTFAKIFIARDLTRKQQAFDKDLRQHAKEFRDQGKDNVKIKAGKVVQILAGGKVSVLYQPSM